MNIIFSLFIAIVLLGMAISRPGYTFMTWVDLIVGGLNFAIVLDKVFL